MIDDGFDTENTGLGLRRHLDVIRRRKLMVFGVLAVTVAAAAVVVFSEKPTYRATSKIVIGQGGGLFSPTLSTAIQPFSATMSDLVKSNIVARRVKENLGLPDTEEEILNKVSISIKPESSVLTISVVDHSRARARAIAQQIGIVFSNLVKRRFAKATPIGPGGEQVPPPSPTIWDPAHISPERVSPRPARDLALAASLGFILGLLAAFLRDHFDRAVRTREEIEERLGVPVIGQIPLERRRSRRATVVANQFSDAAEAYRAVRANLQYLAIQQPLRTILITSASPQQGKTTVTANLAVTIARSGASTVAVEADLRRPRLGDAFGDQGRSAGLTSVLVGNAELKDCVKRVPVFADGVSADAGSAQLSYLSSGPLPPNPSELLSSEQMRHVLGELSDAFDYVLIDSPPLLLVADALELARKVDGVVLVVRRNQTTTDETREIRALVERLDIRLLGTVMTGATAVRTYYSEYSASRDGVVDAAPKKRTEVASRRA